MRTSNIARALVLMLTLGMVAAACSKSTKQTTGGSPTSPSPTSSGGTITIGSDKANDKGTKDFSGKDEGSIELDNFYFEPTVLKGTPGQKIKLELENEGSALHNFTLEAQSIDQDIQSKKKADVSVTFPQSGFLEFFCKYHKALGMVGELSV